MKNQQQTNGAVPAAAELPIGDRRLDGTNIDSVDVKYICYRLLADCQDFRLAKAVLGLCKGNTK